MPRFRGMVEINHSIYIQWDLLELCVQKVFDNLGKYF